MTSLTRRRFFEQAVIAAGAVSAIGQIRHASAATSDDALSAAALEGAAYFRLRAADQLISVEALRAAIASGDLAAARQAYVDARPPYEEIETLAASFPQSDSDIDARPYSFDGGENSPDFRGFHKIEYLLFRDDDLDAAAGFAETLAGTVTTLERELGEPARFSAGGHFEGMIGLAEEIGSRKISSEEETWSDQTLLIFRSNVIGIMSQYAPFSPLVAASDATADERVRGAGDAFRALLQPFETGPGEALTPYSEIGIADRKAMSDATYALRNALVGAAETLRVI